MAENVVSFLVGRLTTLLEEEEKLLSGIQGQVEDLVDELERIKAFLRVADAKEDSNPQLKVCSTISSATILDRAFRKLTTLDFFSSKPGQIVSRMESGSRLKEDPLVHLQGLPNLVHLELLLVYDGESLHFEAGGFPSLKLLGIDKLDELQLVIIEEGAMPCLEKLIIQRCKLLKKVPSGIEHLTNLKLPEFFDMPNELIMPLHPDGGEDHWKVAQICPGSLLFLLERWGLGCLFLTQ